MLPLDTSPPFLPQNANLHMDAAPSLEVFHHLVGLPDPFPGGDKLQNKLFDIFQVQFKADKLRIMEDIESDYKDLMLKINAEVEGRKHAALRLRKSQRMMDATQERKRTQGGMFMKKGVGSEGVPKLDLPKKSKAPFSKTISII